MLRDDRDVEAHVHGRPLAKIRLQRGDAALRVVLELSAVDLALLDAMAAHEQKSREQVVATALRALFRSIPRVGD
jgi:translation initiation factor IF-1